MLSHPDGRLSRQHRVSIMRRPPTPITGSRFQAAQSHTISPKIPRQHKIPPGNQNTYHLQEHPS